MTTCQSDSLLSGYGSCSHSARRVQQAVWRSSLYLLQRRIEPGEEFQLDIKVWANTSKALKPRRAFGRYTGALTAVDLSTRYKIGKLIRTTSAIEEQLDALRIEIRGTGHTLKVLRLDNQFVTAPVKKWAAQCEPYIELQPCIPHKHHSIGDIERFHRTLEDAVFKRM